MDYVSIRSSPQVRATPGSSVNAVVAGGHVCCPAHVGLGFGPLVCGGAAPPAPILTASACVSPSPRARVAPVPACGVSSVGGGAIAPVVPDLQVSG